MGFVNLLRYCLLTRERCPLKVVLFGLLLLVAPLSVPTYATRETPFSQEAKAILEHNFPSANISYLLLDASGSVLAERWTPQQAIPFGALMKPFLAVAYGEQHDGSFPKVRCLGTKSHCWFPGGHGSLDLEEAIADSCNAYFLKLADGLDRQRAAQTFARYDLAGPPLEAKAESLIGLGTEWVESPLTLSRAYLIIDREQQLRIQGRIINGMLESASRGTARGVDASVGKNSSLAKTGTAACTHRPQGAADGFAIVLYPASQPRLLLLVRVHGITGAECAKVAGAMLRSLGAGV